MLNHAALESLSMKPIQCLVIAVTICAAMRVSAQANAGWESVKRIHAGESIRVRSLHRVSICNFERADDELLMCAEQRKRFFVPVRSQQVLRRTEIQSIRFSRRDASTVAGTGIGVAAGGGIGAAVDASAKNQVEEGHIMTVVLGFLGGFFGAGVGHHTDFLAGPVIYRAP